MAFWYSLIELKITFSLSESEVTCSTDEIPYLSQTLVGRGRGRVVGRGKGSTAAELCRESPVRDFSVPSFAIAFSNLIGLLRYQAKI